MFAEVAFPIRGFQTFTYSIPKRFKDRIQIGSRVNASFGRRTAQGIVVGLKKSTSFTGNIKDIKSLVDDISVMTPALWKLITWISDYYTTPIGQVARALFPRNLSTRYTPPKQWYVQSNISLINQLDNLKNRAPKQYELLKIINKSEKKIAISSLKTYVANPMQICKVLQKKNLVYIYEKTSFPDATGFTFDPIFKEIRFNKEQRSAIEQILISLNKNIYDSFLLHGVTGSGKTELYIEAVRRCLSQNRTAIILLPEISLTPQIAGRFRAVFGDTIALWHSRLTQQQRSWTWKQICIERYQVVIGARSAVFSPINNLGLIVIDEEQESSFHQDSPAPRYHARDVALMRGRYEKAVVIISSATPSLESYFNHIHNKIKYLRLSKRFGGAKYPIVHIVDMLSDKEETGKVGQVISGLLQDKIEERLSHKEQIILLQNRRGFSSAVRCRDCAGIVMCPECFIALTFHQKRSKLICHFCGHSKANDNISCNNCNSVNLYYSGSGTQKVEMLIKETFPNANVSRLDMDTSKGKPGITSILKSFSTGKIDILIGTQMIAKGLDFPNATLVGIINADLGLYIPDFRAGEKVFQLIYQASGRAGRSKKQGEVVIQSFSPENPVIKSAGSLNIMEYYKIAMLERKELNYPPFSWLAKIEVIGIDRESVRNLAIKISKTLIGHYKGLDVLGPAPCYLEKLRKKFRYQLVCKSIKTIDPNGVRLHRFIRLNFTDEHKKFRHGTNRINIHFDPISLI